MAWHTSSALKAHPWRVVLLRRGSKKPEGSSWTVTTDLRTIRGHLASGGGIGLVCGEQSGVAVLDFDDEAARVEMFSTLGALTPWVGSPSGGVHIYVRWTPGLPAKMRWQGRVVGEVQRGAALGGSLLQHVVLPPTPYPGNEKRGVPPGGRYKWLVDPAGPLPELPDAWRSHLLSAEGGSDPVRQFASSDRDATGLERPSFIPDGDARGTEHLREQKWDGPDATELQRRALQQPGAKLRSNGAVKFQCYGCQQEGRDRHYDNARVGPDGRWGCAVDNSHKRAIAIQLGVIRW